jgi:hypothetical protein
MENRFEKFFQLFGGLFFTFVGAIISIILIMLGIKLLMSGLDQISWMTYLYMSTMILIPPAIFISGFTIFLFRTHKHPNKFARWFSYPIFLATIISWVAIFVRDFRYFLQTKEGEIGYYYCFSLYCLGASMALIFLMGIIQALAMPAEKDWLEKHQSAN